MTVTAYTKAAVDTQLAAKLDAAAAAELIRDTIGSALVAGSNVTIVPNDAGDIITISAAGGAGSPADATTTSKGVVQLAGDLGGTAAAPTVPGLTGKLAAASNLSDLASASTARTNLGLGTAATAATSAFDAAGAASTAQAFAIQRANHTGTQAATTITGLATVATTGAYSDLTGAPSLTTITANTQTGTTYTLVLSDAGKVVEMNNAAANTLTIPPNSTAAFPVGTVVEVFQLGAGQATVTAGAGVTLRAPDGAKTAKQYASASLRKRATDEWVLAGSVSV